MKMQFDEDEFQVLVVLRENLEEKIADFFQNSIEQRGFLVKRFVSKNKALNFFLRVNDKKRFAEEAVLHPIWKEKSFHQDLIDDHKKKETEKEENEAASPKKFGLLKKSSTLAKRMKEAQMKRVHPEVRKYEEFEWLNLNAQFFTSTYEFVVRHLTQEEQLRVIWGMLSKIKIGDEILFEQLVANEKINHHGTAFTSTSSLVFAFLTLRIVRLVTPLNSATRPTIKTASIENLKKYYGEVGADYFIFADKYIRFLVIPAVWGLVCVLARSFKVMGDYRLDLLDCSFAIMMIVWAAVFTGSWKRQCKIQCFEWGANSDVSSMNEKNPQYYGPMRVSAVTGFPEVHYPSSLRNKQYAKTVLQLFLLTLVSFSITLLNLNLRDQIHKHSPLVYSPWLSSLAQPGALLDKTSWRRHLVSLFEVIIIIQFLGFANAACESTTEAENHKTIERKRRSLGLKRFMFFMMSGVFYYIFLTLFGGSFQEVKSTLYSVITIASCVRLIMECGIPYMKVKYQQKGDRKVMKTIAGGEKNDFYFERKASEADLEEYDVFNEYFSMMEQYSYLMLFAPNFQIGPLIALVFNFFERKTDLIKVLYANRRPFPMKLPGSRVWQIFQHPWNVISIYAICIQLIFDSPKLRAMLYFLGFRGKYEDQEGEGPAANQYFLLIVSIHMFLLVYFVIHNFLKKRPKWIKLYYKRKAHNKIMGI